MEVDWMKIVHDDERKVVMNIMYIHKNDDAVQNLFAISEVTFNGIMLRLGDIT